MSDGDAERLRRHESGRYRLAAEPAAVAAELTAWGWRVGVLDVSGLDGKRELLAAIGSALAFPEWYGHNLDALADCLSDLCEPTALVVVGHAQTGATGVRHVLDDRIAAPDGAPFAVVVTAS